VHSVERTTLWPKGYPWPSFDQFDVNLAKRKQGKNRCIKNK